MRLKKQLFFLLLPLLFLSACSPKEIVYFQDLTPDSTEIAISNAGVIRLRPLDKISIIVNTDNQQLNNMFNLATASRTIGGSGGGGQNVSTYTIDQQGDIDFPHVGKIHVEGMTREEVAATIKNRLVSESLVKNPIVTVEFVNLTINILGEVSKPGRYDIDKDELTILDAIGMAGDLAIVGKRNKVMVLRNEDGKQKVYGINMTSGEEIFNSPAYYLQQGDIVYVQPNSKRARESTTNGNTVRSASFWISVTSLIISVINLLNRL